MFETKKSISVEQPRERRRSSIEEKISKIREKILKTEHIPETKAGLGHLKPRESYNLKPK